jgi:hypothetical protein
MQDDLGECFVDVCQNIDGLQKTMPSGYAVDVESGDCQETPLENAVLFINELLPNATSTDTGKEFIELYNPNNRTIDLTGYVLQVGPSFSKQYVFSGGQFMPNSYIVLSDTDSGIVLPNTNGVQLRLVAPSGVVVSETPIYSAASDDHAWALLDDQWIFTNQPTPSAANKPYLEPAREEVLGVTTVLAPCPEGKYRNPETNRCRNIETAVSLLSSCDEDEYRNPETNRCRKITTSTLVPCQPNQVRNPVTNRCRSVTTVSSNLVSCKEGQERNPETNRCRNVSSVASQFDGGVPTITDTEVQTTQGSLNWLSISVIISATIAYMLYEWRHELRRSVRKRVAQR